MAQNKYKRRIYIVDHSFQYWFIGKVVIMSLLFVSVSLLGLTAVQQLAGDVTVAIVQPCPFGSSQDEWVASTTSVFGLVWPVMALCMVLTLVITFCFALFTSHRLAGPVFRIRRVLQQMGSGDLNIHVKLRQKDAFASLADAVNSLSLQWKVYITELQKLSEDLSTCKDDEEREDKLKRMHEMLKRFKTQ
jgi:methyl-accepting chemotaxis protein